MKLASEGKVTLEIDEELIDRVSEGDAWRAEMLKQTTKTATLMEVSQRDHIELRTLIVDNKVTLARVAAAIGILLSLLLGTTVVM
jgi:hypothetical protein